MYQVLARKYRPRNFNQLVGQTHVSRALTSALERNRLHHAYLFTGTRGVGKTTIARILSKCLNCETGITATPCEVCATCVAINQGRFIDLIEIDAASRTKVEDTRELLDNVPYAPTQGRYKVYLIDEVHMLSTHSFNALLKTLEEPPEHVKFLLATTDPQKLPVTVLSRCLQFTLRPLQQQEIHDHLHNILDQEQIGYDDKALWQLAEAAQGSLRDALSLTDQAIAFGQGQLQGSDVQDMLGLLDKGQIVHLLQSIYQNNGQQVSQILQNLANQAVDLKAVLDQLITLLHQLALLQVLPQVPLQGTQEYQQQLRQLAQQVDPSDVQLYYQIALQGRQDLKLAVSLQQGFDMCILRMLAFKPLGSNTQIVEHSSAGLIAAQQPTQVNASNHTPVLQPASAAPDDQLAKDNTSLAVDPTKSIPELQDTPIKSTDQPEITGQTGFEELAPKDELILDDATESQFIEHEILENQLIENQTIEHDLLTQNEFFVSQSNALDLQPLQVAEQERHELDLFGEAIRSIPAEQTRTLTEADQQVDVVSDTNLNSMQQWSNEQAFEAVNDLNIQGQNTQLQEVQLQDNQANEIKPQEVWVVPQQITVIPESNPSQLLPQQILQHSSVELTGQWNIEKWECWLREADISPAIRNLAQHGLIRGEIGQTSIFVISPEHRLMATELFDGLIAALTQQWPDSSVELVFEPINEPLPLELKAIRREKALQQADYLLRQEPVVQPLIAQFEASLTNVSFKE
ncbi:DNA polymerase III subunit gamma/tau [Alkanindiges illinoisensis]|uniref:DNA polymerase III subunit gamma/tau n=1 Tax=Alkanindiges illinoisensis TaxID=197183 RepID=UPI00047C4ECB|nr:DNA polymerase III subunit gamma/tau [Alkanindiges illinoisensis]